MVSRQRLDDAETEARAARESAAAAAAAARLARAELERAHAALIEPEEAPPARPGDRIPVLVLRSPVDGVVLRRHHESSAVVAAGEPLLEVASLADLEVIADFLTSDAVRMRPGMRALVERWGGGRALEARVRRVEPAGFLKVSALGVEEQRVCVVLDLDEPHDAWRALGDGYRVQVRVVVHDLEDALKIPTGSLFRHGERWAAFAVRDGRARLVELDLGPRNQLEAVVRSGLDEGDRVIVHPPGDVSDGARVEARPS